MPLRIRDMTPEEARRLGIPEEVTVIAPVPRRRSGTSQQTTTESAQLRKATSEEMDLIFRQMLGQFKGIPLDLTPDNAGEDESDGE